MAYLSGKKSYLVAAAMVILAGLHSQGYLNDSAYATFQTVLLGGGIAALRAGISKTNGK